MNSDPLLPRRLSLVAQTVQSLRDGLQNGHWMERLPAERELVKRLQVGRKTLRAALKELEREGQLRVDGRRRRTIQACPELDRVPVRTVGILVQAPLETLHARRMFVINAVRENLGKADCRTELHVSSRAFTARPAHALNQLTRDHPGAVWLVFGSKEPMQRWFTNHAVPCLIIGSGRPEIPLPSIDVDHRAACHHAANVLWRKGHRRLALVVPEDAFDGDDASERGLRESLSGKSGVNLWTLRHDGTKPHLCALLDQALGAPEPPTAFIVARAGHALTVTMHLMRRGKAIPREISVISRDEEPFLEATSPAVARYRISLPLYARRISMAARQLAETGALPAHATRLMPEFVAGETV